ncbi:MAG: hypothetical protein P9L92_05260 [Candidatus Electryonea clarkiae]|nr:hypothetical protein [Candidatus Electryonea clarkiae]MDP8286907.1 hypothetical protein [Candidatus Electryonea clarkiae]
MVKKSIIIQFLEFLLILSLLTASGCASHTSILKKDLHSELYKMTWDDALSQYGPPLKKEVGGTLVNATWRIVDTTEVVRPKQKRRPGARTRVRQHGTKITLTFDKQRWVLIDYKVKSF